MFTKRSLIALLMALVFSWAFFSSITVASMMRDEADAGRIVLSVLSVGAVVSVSAMLAYLLAAWVRRHRDEWGGMLTRRSLMGFATGLGLLWALFSSIAVVGMIRDEADAEPIIRAVLLIGVVMSVSGMLAYLVAAWVRRRRGDSH